ncbi:MAG: hypothetical protein ACI9X4_001174 [Glaciecola sp.]|jgi:hypothetical protein
MGPSTMNASSTMNARIWLLEALKPHLDGKGLTLLERGGGTSEDHVSELATRLAQASRHAKRRDLNLSAQLLGQAQEIQAGWNPERYSVLETLRVALILSREDLQEESFQGAFEEAFRFADEGELRALYKSLALLPNGERFELQASEGCRTNILGVFESVVCDSPYAAKFFPDVAWHSACIKSLFMESPLWRFIGLDERLCPELARMALDLVEERRSATRPILANLWLLVGSHGGPRGMDSLIHEWNHLPASERGAVALAMARAGGQDQLREWLVANPGDVWLEKALAGETQQVQWRAFEFNE